MSIELDEAVLGKRAGNAPDLYYASAMPSEGLKAVLGIIHGYADHGARYRHVMGALAEHGIGSIAIDLRGHGRALGPRGFCNRFDEFLDDARELRRLVDERARGAPRGRGERGDDTPAVPTFLFGHSFGGLVATSSILESAGQFRGLVLSAPFFGLALEVPRVKVLAGKVASRVYPRLGLPSNLAGKDMTHDAERARAYDEDPLVFPNATARWFTETVGAQERALANASRLTLPLYVAFGTGDKIASMAAAKRVFAGAGSADKTWDAREGLYHEVLNEPSWKDLVESIARWVIAHA
ncbi:MAG: lysophospholipase [Labilithrix sp.]|nr:lysophospholipase [Labilithrix sp.]MBX3219601.1 lysophospholipase [Labilithrix sp.]